MSLETIARYLVYTGVALLVVGGGILLLAKLGLAPGKLPGDIVIRRGNGTLYIPIATSILGSIILTILLNLIFRLFKR
jgi:hypothetical protein